MTDYSDKTKEELLGIIAHLEEQLARQTTPTAGPATDAEPDNADSTVPARFREKYYRDILDALPDMVTVCDYDANFIELVSAPHTNHVEGVSNERLLRSNLRDVVPEDAYKAIRGNYDKVIGTGQPHIAHHSLLFHGRKHHYENRVCKLGEKYLLTMCRDITERVEAEKALIDARTKAEEADRLKSSFLANMSHEIRTPLNAIVGFSRLVIEPGDTEEKREYCTIMEHNCELLLTLFNDILDLSSLEAGSMVFAREQVSLYAVCQREYLNFQDKMAPGVQLILDPIDRSIEVPGDRRRIGQVLSNLLSNAAKFTPEGEIHFGFEVMGSCVQFYVQDTGIGIPPNRISTIFERFSKLNNFAQGTGLGFTLCRQLVEHMGGRISVNSVQERGTTFYFTLPIR